MRRQPPYHLRPNKAVDRLTFLDSIKRLERITPLNSYTYYGFGGPYLEEFRLLYEFCPEVRMVSIEADKQVLKRQKFHLPCGTLKLKQQDFNSFLSAYTSNDSKSIFWMDYQELDYSHFAEFMSLLPKVAERSVIKVSVRCHPSDYLDADSTKEIQKAEDFNERFGAILPSSPISIPRTRPALALLIQTMFQIASQKALPASCGLRFQPLTSFYYQDGSGMYSITGIVIRRQHDELNKIRSTFRDWDFANLNWGKPREIDLPILSTKERLFLQSHLPSSKTATIAKILGYSVAKGRNENRRLLRQYSLYHRYFPFFIKAIP